MSTNNGSTNPIQPPPHVSITSLTAKESGSESCFTFRHVSLTSFILESFLDFQELDISENQLFGRWSLVWICQIFLWSRNSHLLRECHRSNTVLSLHLFTWCVSGLSHYWHCSFRLLSKGLSACLLCCNISFFPSNDINGWAFCGQVQVAISVLTNFHVVHLLVYANRTHGHLLQFDAQPDPEEWGLLQASFCAFHIPASILWGLPVFLAWFEAPGFFCPLSYSRKGCHSPLFTNVELYHLFHETDPGIHTEPFSYSLIYTLSTWSQISAYVPLHLAVCLDRYNTLYN